MMLAMVTSALTLFKQPEATPDLLRTIMGVLSNEETTWKAAPQPISSGGVVAHIGEV